MGIDSRSNSKSGILLVNLGSPDSPDVVDVRRYLHQFLMDRHVIDVPYLLRKLIVSGFILPFRPKRSAQAYRSIWSEEGSPLIVISRRVHRLLAERIETPAELAMRYGNPSIEAGLVSLVNGSPRIATVRVVPLYPHYAMSTVQSTVAEVLNVVERLGLDIGVEVVKPFFDDSAYIEALAESACGYLDEEYDHLLISYHGLPERHIRKTDPTGGHCMAVNDCCNIPSPAHEMCYRHQVFRTAELLAERLSLRPGSYTVSFQSRLGKDAWLEPFTVSEAVRLAESGVRKLVVMCPAFVSDCLETIEEVGVGVKGRFLQAGGESFRLIPCLNDHSKWIDALGRYCTEGSFATLVKSGGAGS